MAKKLFYSMGEVSEMFDVNASLILSLIHI